MPNSHIPLPQPSESLRTAINYFATGLKTVGYEISPDWMLQAAALIGAFRIFRKANELHFLFDGKNPYDLAMLTWCIVADKRERRESPEGVSEASTAASTFPDGPAPQAGLASIESPPPMPDLQKGEELGVSIPSQKLQSILQVYEDHLRKNAPKGHLPWEIMAASMIKAYRTFRQSDELDILFDSDNSFDCSMHSWCIEVDRRRVEENSTAKKVARLN